jgi:hypothetical protein
MNNTDYSKLSPIDRIALYIESEDCLLLSNEHNKQIVDLFRKPWLFRLAAIALLQVGALTEFISAARSFYLSYQSIADDDKKTDNFINDISLIAYDLPSQERHDIFIGLSTIFKYDELILRKIAEMTADQGDLLEAEIIIKDAIQHNPHSINCYFRLIDILSEQGKKKEAFDVCLQTMNIQQFETFFHDSGIDLAIELKDYDGVRRFAEATLSYYDLNPQLKNPNLSYYHEDEVTYGVTDSWYYRDAAVAYLVLGFLEKQSRSDLSKSYLEKSMEMAEKYNDRSHYENLEQKAMNLGWEDASQLFREKKLLTPEEIEPDSDDNNDDNTDIKTTTTPYLTGFPPNYLERYVTTGFLPALRSSLLNNENKYFVSEEDKNALDFLIAPTFRIGFANELAEIGLVEDAKKEISDLVPFRESLNYSDGNCMDFVIRQHSN